MMLVKHYDAYLRTIRKRLVRRRETHLIPPFDNGSLITITNIRKVSVVTKVLNELSDIKVKSRKAASSVGRFRVMIAR